MRVIKASYLSSNVNDRSDHCVWRDIVWQRNLQSNYGISLYCTSREPILIILIAQFVENKLVVKRKVCAYVVIREIVQTAIN